jgi:hypothetical protein
MGEKQQEGQKILSKMSLICKVKSHDDPTRLFWYLKEEFGRFSLPNQTSSPYRKGTVYDDYLNQYRLVINIV